MKPIRAFLVPYTRGIGAHLIDIHNDSPEQNTADATVVWPHFMQSKSAKPYATRGMQFIVACRWPLANLPDAWRTVAVGGHLVLWVPAEADPAPGMAALAGTSGEGWEIVEDDLTDGRRFVVFRKRGDAACKARPWKRMARSVLVVRLGAIGDQIMASSILPGLKAQGWHVTWNAQPPSSDVLAHDPHIDRFWIQDRGQVPEEELGPYMAALSTRFDRVINLCESVEAIALGLPGRVTYDYPATVRRAIFNRNYVELTHLIAEVPGPFRPRFYPTAEEIEMAKDVRAQVGGRPIVTVALAGSGPFKIWPYTAQAVVPLLYETDAAIVLAGADKDRQAEDLVASAVDGYFHKDGKRLIRTCGRWPIRGSLTMALHSDVVLGPETGLLNAVSHEPDVAKVVMLSHSSVENLTRDWVNAVSMVGDVPPACYPCHRLHHDWSTCNRDERTGAAACMAAIPSRKVAAAVRDALRKRYPAAV
jgi:ADP-heptose:LPS heptosyltransferase